MFKLSAACAHQCCGMIAHLLGIQGYKHTFAQADGMMSQLLNAPEADLPEAQHEVSQLHVHQAYAQVPASKGRGVTMPSCSNQPLSS